MYNMKNITVLLIACIATSFATAQDVVKWTWSAKKLAPQSYELSFSAKVEKPWHIYSQSTPDGGPLPTVFAFNKNPLITFNGKVKESGKLLQKHEEVFGVDVKYFAGNVVFTQLVKLKSKVKTTISGSIEFMACNEEQCLPPKEVPFKINLE